MRPREKKRRPARDMNAVRIFEELERDDLLPAILFRSSRKQCDQDVERLSEELRSGRSKSYRQQMQKEVQAIADKYQISQELLDEHPQLNSLLETGCGAHHAGQLLAWRLLLEELMSRGMMKMMIATGTVAAGVDFPARTVVVTAHSRRGNEGFQNLSSSEFQQMSGRAGRRGRDAVGLCLVAPGHFCDARVIKQIAEKPPEPLRSAYFASPSTVLNLLKYRSVDELRFMIGRSLASFVDRKHADAAQHESEELEAFVAGQESSEISQAERKRFAKRARRRKKEAELLRTRQVEMLELSLDGFTKLKYLDERGLTDKGVWAAELCTSLLLYLAEAIEEGLFYELSELELIALIASVAGDAHRNYFSLAQNPFSKEFYGKFEDIIERVETNYHGPSTVQDLQVLPDAALTVLSWAQAENWSDFSALLRLAGVAEGDAARLITQTADHLQQIMRLKESHPGLAQTAGSARSVLLRPPLTDTLIESL